jgi:P-type Ca2+ transporter type 2C
MATVIPPSDVTGTANGTAWHTLPGLEAARVLHVHRSSGLTRDEASGRLAEFGPNRLAGGPVEPRSHAFARQFGDPVQLVLLGAAVGSFALGDVATSLVVLFVTVVNAALALGQEGRPRAAVAALQNMVAVTARVRRDATVREIPSDALVPGDVALVTAGGVVPADGRLLETATLEVDESLLTGESVPVSKGVDSIDDPAAPLGDRSAMLYMGTNVTRGTAEFVVTATGMATEVGHISGLLEGEEGSDTPVTRRLGKLTGRILVIAGVALVVSLLLNLLRGQAIDTVLTAAIAFAIAAVPAGLPLVVTTILARGTDVLAKAGATAKRPCAAQTIGTASAINADKTGTLTIDEPTAVELALPGRRYAISGSGYGIEGAVRHVAGQPEVPLEPVLLPLALASDAVVEHGELSGDPTEGALVVLAEKAGVDVTGTRAAHPRVAELPFDAAYKLMATFHRMTMADGTAVIRCFVKGAPDQLLGRAAAVLGPDLRPVRLTEELTGRYLEETARLARQGLRVIATASRDFAARTFDPGADLLRLVDNVTLLALVGIVDPPRRGAKASIAQARAAGIQVRMVTGDHAATAEAIARKLGIGGRAVTGAEFAAMSNEQAGRDIADIGVIARATPEHKVRLVDTLRRNGHVVAATGDGVDDAPALEAADIGIATRSARAEVSGEAAAMTATGGLSTIVRAVEAGRGVCENLVRYLRFQLGVLAGMILTFLGSAVLNVVGGLPFLPLQVLYLTFTTQVFQSIGLGCGTPSADLMDRSPRPVDEPVAAARSYRWPALVGVIQAAVTLGVIAFAEHRYGTATARTMGLVTFSLTSVLFSFGVRDETSTIFSLDTVGARSLLIAAAGSLVATVIAAETGLMHRIIDTAELDLGQWAICVGAALPLLLAAELRAFTRIR